MIGWRGTILILSVAVSACLPSPAVTDRVVVEVIKGPPSGVRAEYGVLAGLVVFNDGVDTLGLPAYVLAEGRDGTRKTSHADSLGRFSIRVPPGRYVLTPVYPAVGHIVTDTLDVTAGDSVHIAITVRDWEASFEHWP